MRIPRTYGGKSGGFRVVYLFGGYHMPLFLVAVFAKNEKANLSRSEQAALVEMAKQIASLYGEN